MCGMASICQWLQHCANFHVCSVYKLKRNYHLSTIQQETREVETFGGAAINSFSASDANPLSRNSQKLHDKTIQFWHFMVLSWHWYYYQVFPEMTSGHHQQWCFFFSLSPASCWSATGQGPLGQGISCPQQAHGNPFYNVASQLRLPVLFKTPRVYQQIVFFYWETHQLCKFALHRQNYFFYPVVTCWCHNSHYILSSECVYFMVSVYLTHSL